MKTYYEINNQLINLNRGITSGLRLLKHMFSLNNKTAYIGWVGQNNLGDEILYQAHTKLFPELNPVLFKKSKLVELYSKITKKPLYNLGILGGGTLINQSEIWLNQVNFIINNNLPIFCFGTGVASKDFWKSQDAITWRDRSREWTKAFQSFTFIGVRGPYSKKRLESYGVKNVIIVGDTALSLAPDNYILKKQNKIIGLNIGIVSDNPIFGNEHKFYNEVISLINYLITKGYTIHLLPIWKKDLESNKKIVKEVNNKKCLLINKFNSFKKYTNEINKCDLFIGQKLHSTIIACMNRIPSIMIEYRPKCRDFMASIDMEEYTIKTSDFKAKRTIALLNKLFSNYNLIQKKLDIKINRYKKIQTKYAQIIKNKKMNNQLITSIIL